MNPDKTNIILIGMAGCGKSSVGRLLAKRLGRLFIDTDDLIVQSQQRPLQEIIDTEGPLGFRRIEEGVLLNITVHSHVIATGGSSIYSVPGMNHLEKSGVIVLLRANMEILKKRVGDTSERGLVKLPAQSFEELFIERSPLYEKYGHMSVDCSDLTHEEACLELIDLLR